MEINSKNVIGWLELILKVFDLPKVKIEALEAFIGRKDVSRRQKEIEEYWRC